MNTPLNDPSPLPSVGATSTVTGISAILGWGAMFLANKWHLPVDVIGGVLGLVFTGLTSLWHRYVPSK